LIHYSPLSSNHSLKLIEDFSKSVKAEKEISQDDSQRWDMDRIIKYQFDDLYYTEVDGKIVNMTFHKWYGDYLRIAINSYTLKEYRKQVFRPVWKKGGYLDMANELYGDKVKGFFCTFYPKNEKIQSVIKVFQKNLGKRSFGFGGVESGWLDRFELITKDPILFRYVPQHIVYCNISGTPQKNQDELLRIISS
jgi:hypothetical protein